MKLRLTNIKEEAGGARSFILEPSEPLSWTAGQYMHYTLPHPHEDDRGVERWFTISAAPFEKHVQITTRIFPERRSSFKSVLLNLAKGEQIEADGPGGKFVLADAPRHIFVSGGIGITPFRSILAQARHDNQKLDVELLYANRDEQLVFGDELDAIAAAGIGLSIRRFIGEQKITADDLTPYVKEADSIIYLSGPEPMVKNYQEILTKLGLPEERLKTDDFPGYEAEH